VKRSGTTGLLPVSCNNNAGGGFFIAAIS
jgi:hypothetical protein